MWWGDWAQDRTDMRTKKDFPPYERFPTLKLAKLVYGRKSEIYDKTRGCYFIEYS